MTYGLLTRRTDGTSIITPRTFTVRVVDMFAVSFGLNNANVWASWGTGSAVLNRPLVRPGMFATCTPMHTYTPFDPYKSGLGMAGYQSRTQGAQIPRITCGNGQLILTPPVPGGEFGGYFYIHVYEYL